MDARVNEIFCHDRLRLGTWQALERAIARFLHHLGFSDVSIVGGTGDGGADIVAVLKGKRWVIQAKYRSQGSIGIGAVKEVMTALQSYAADVALLITNRTFNESVFLYRSALIQNGYDLRLWDGDELLRRSEDLREDPWHNRLPRDYQRQAIDAIHRSVEEGGQRGLITLATGLGKTMVAATFISEYLYRYSKQCILVLAHQSDLVKQLDNSCWPQFSKYIETHIWTDGERPAYFTGVIFATWQSIISAMSRGEDFSNLCSLVVVDECHHAPSPAFTALIEHLSPDYLLGVTATPWRGDGESLRPLFGDPLFSMSVVEGMQRGFLANVDYRMMIDDIDWEEIHDLSREGLTVKDLNSRLYIPERDLGMIESIVEHMGQIKHPRVLIFSRSIDHAERIQQFLLQYGISAAAIHSNLSRQDRFLALSNFRTGGLKVLISIEMLNEGIDVPEVNMVVFARVTHSRRIFLQQLGRGLRVSEAKQRVLVLDFVADIRRISAAVSMNREAREFAISEEVRYPNGDIVAFNTSGDDFFREYLADMADLSDLDETARLEFPAEWVND